MPYECRRALVGGVVGLTLDVITRLGLLVLLLANHLLDLVHDEVEVDFGCNVVEFVLGIEE